MHYGIIPSNKDTFIISTVLYVITGVLVVFMSKSLLLNSLSEFMITRRYANTHLAR